MAADHVTDLLEQIARLARVDIDDLDSAIPAIEAALVAAEAMGEARHAAQSETAPSRSVVGRTSKPPTKGSGDGRRLSPVRLRWRETASRMVGVALPASGGASAVGRRLGLSGGDIVERWADPEHVAAIALGDVLAAGPTFAAIVLGAAMAAASDEAAETGMPIERQVARITVTAARLVEHDDAARADGHLSDEELRGYLTRIRAAIGACTGLERRVLRDLATGVQR